MDRLVTILKNKYFLIIVITAAVFGVVWRLADITAAIFYSIMTAMLLFFITFDPRIEKH